MADASRTLEVLAAATRLGLTSFGGPVAHLGYFHEEYVRKRKWVDERRYADLVAVSVSPWAGQQPGGYRGRHRAGGAAGGRRGLGRLHVPLGHRPRHLRHSSSAAGTWFLATRE